jgi:phosphoglycolate phosphatase-like HAD superfamily hydrolase
VSATDSAPVLLWDIDGTLLRSPGVGVQAFAHALESVTGRPIAKARYDFGGKTDPLIARDLLAAVGITDETQLPVLVQRMLDEVDRSYDRFADALRETLVVLDGTIALLEHFTAERALQSVVTGNIRSVARRKLEAGGMDHHLLLDHGGYGSDHHDRTELVRLALARLAAHEGSDSIDPERVWIIGDTPRDVACAQGAGVRCLLVATGTYGVDQLDGLGADHVLADLADTERVVRILDG